MIKAASLDLQHNLRDFSQALLARGVPHRINEESGRQVIWVNSEAEADWVRRALEEWQLRGPIESAAPGRIAPGKRVGAGAAGLLRETLGSPVTMALILGCVLVALISGLGRDAQRVELLFFPLVAASDIPSMLADLLNPLLFLRSLTPIFLHFGELHLIFNLLWLWYFGRQLEAIQPSWVLLLVIVLIAFISNATQYLTLQYNNFGGMSGVVYGLVGYTWVIHNFMPKSRLMLNNTMFVFFVIALILMEVFAGSWIATAAHVGGLLSGLLIGLGMVLIYRLLLGRQAISRQRGGFL